MNIYSAGCKRPYEGPIETGAPAPKRSKLSEQEVVASTEVLRFCRWGGTELPIDVVSHLVTFLPPRDMIKFSAIAKGAIAFTEASFKEMRQQNQWYFACSLEEKESYPQRASYIFAHALEKYVGERLALIKNPQSLLVAPRPSEAQVKALYGRFQSIMRRFPPSLGRYMWKDLNSMAPLQMDGKLFLENSSSALSKSEQFPSLAGDELLEGLSHLTTYCDLIWKGNQNLAPLSLGKALSHLTHAISSGATSAAHLAIYILAPFSSSTVDYCKNLATTSASCRDFRGVKLLLNSKIMDARQAYQSGLHYPPILMEMGIKQIKEKQGESLFEEAIKGYGNSAHAPLCIWLYAGINKKYLGKYEEAEKYLEKASMKTSVLLPKNGLSLWDNLMLVKMHLKKWEEAEKCGTKVILFASLMNRPIPLTYWSRMATINAYLNNWDEAYLYLNKTISSRDFNPTHPNYFEMCETVINIKKKEEKWEEAEFYIDKIANLPNPIFRTLAAAAKIKFHLKKWQEAKKYSDQAWAIKPSKVPADIEQLVDNINAQYALSRTT